MKSGSTRSLLIHQLTDAFSNKAGIQWFIKALIEKYPRHLVDPLKVMQKAALKDVLNFRLINGNDFPDITYSLDLQIHQSSVIDVQLNQKHIELRASERSSNICQKVLSGGRMR